MSQTPTEPEQHEEFMSIAVNGEVVCRIEMKPDALLSDLEDETVSLILGKTFGGALDDEDGDSIHEIELIQEYDPEIQLYLPEDDGEMDWSQPMNLSETEYI
ncbi:hypothetical protein EKH57_00250 (plasmid) [Halorubrum sp. BOL3-1]|uniref:hypothetical protein n=1 Tax=Halorubrum sp. BOL3-1 TaxID=2497325 RepID=UPI001004F752|nr:hypothetical protein [Halorubrum sp. BOL3-1]QAU11356.1 hypothetical protein EKH57_00250 [Halorubrum sp. BOL3-1]